jgi:very-short-patch-repair endonuclease
MDLEQLARGDVVSAARLAAATAPSECPAAAVRAGALVPLIRGWYAVRPPTSDRDLHWLRTVAAWHRYDGRALISHQSLVIAQGLPDYALDLRTVHLTRCRPGTTRTRPDVKVHRPLGQTDCREDWCRTLSGGGMDRVPTAVGIVQAGLEGMPLSALVAADAALRRGFVTADDLAAAGRLLARSRGIGPVRAILREADGRTESPGETVIGHRLRSLGHVLVPQFAVDTDLGTKHADFRIRGTRVLVEFDGAEKYATQSAGFSEKKREDAMRRKGWFFARYVWADLDNVPLIRSRADQAIADSRRWAA